MTHRRGSIYIVVLFSVLVISVCGVGAILALRVDRANAELSHDVAEARTIAHSALEYGLQLLADDADWRTNRAGEQWLSMSFGSGQMVVRVVDDTGDFTDDTSEGVRIIGEGLVGDARQMVRADLEPTLIPLPVLDHMLWVGGRLSVGIGARIADGGAAIGATGGVKAETADVFPPAISEGAVTGSTYHGGTRSGIDPVLVPDVADVIAEYETRGTAIDPTSIGSLMEGVGVSAGHNPWGSKDDDAIYVIDLNGGHKLTIRNSRINACLVVKGAAAGNFTIDQSVIWDAPPGMPALLVEGVVTIDLSLDPLDEADINANLNKVFMPYEGVWNSNMTDLYPSYIRGLIAVSGALSIMGESSIHGVVLVGGDCAIQAGAQLLLSYDETFAVTAPTTLQQVGGMTLVPGSIARHVE